MSRGVGVQFQTQQPQQSRYPPPPPPEPSQSTQPQMARKPSKSGAVRKAVAVIVALVILIVVLYVLFVPKLIEQEEVREAKYEMVDQGYNVNDEWECIDYGWLWCDEYGWVRHFSAYATVRAIETEGAYVVSAEVKSGLYYAGENAQKTYYIYENDVRTFQFTFPSYIVSESQHNQDTTYTMDFSVSAPKTVVKEKLTIFESLF